MTDGMKAAIALLLMTGTAAAAPSTGTITGTVSWKGEAPARAELDRSRDPVCAKNPRLAEDVVVTGGKLRDVHVRIKLGTAGTHAAPATAVSVIQRDCMYAPRVVGLVAGQKLEVVNGDPTFHNVRGNLGTKILWNLAQAAAAPAITRSDVGKAGEVVSLHCDVHPWMAAWAVVSDHPFFDVTEADGAFELRDVPAGTYTLEAWHPTLGLKTVKVKVKKGKTAKASFAFAAASGAAR
jgi:plastocyanin